jgi:hypothetical protein
MKTAPVTYPPERSLAESKELLLEFGREVWETRAVGAEVVIPAFQRGENEHI